MLNKHKIIDCFLFYNELDMLEFRLTELNEHVNYFFILDSDFDFAGNKKDSIFELNKNRFDSWKEKIIRIDCPELTIELFNQINTEKYTQYKNLSTDIINKDNIIFYMMIKLIERLPQLELINNREYSLKDLKLKMNNLIPVKYLDLRDEYSLMNYEGNLPKNVHLLPEQPVRRNWKRDVLIKTEDITNDGDFFQTINVSFVTDTINKIDENTIVLPKDILYGDYNSLEEFQKTYGYNELKKIIKNLYLLNEDIITFDFGEPKSFTWQKIKHRYISELL